MSTKKLCDACGSDMTDDPAAERLGFTFKRTAEHGPDAWPGHDKLTVVVSHASTDQLAANIRRNQKDVCSSCVQRAVADGEPVSLGPVLR